MLTRDRPAPTGIPPMVPRPFRVRRRRQDTGDVATLTLVPVDGRTAGFAPGQFSMLYAFGVGEAPISLSGDPADREAQEYTVRAVGGVTRALVAAEVGDVLGVRGPYGVGWDVRASADTDLVLVAGGIGVAPLRPVVRQVIASRPRFGAVHLVYGARCPADLLYRDELERWRGAGVEVSVTVDRADAGWPGRVGLVTEPLREMPVDPGRTRALVCGPEVMMRHVVTTLRHRGVRPERIRLSLERSMHCGVGLCGHCQLRELLVCVDGPVVSLDRLGPLVRTREL